MSNRKRFSWGCTLFEIMVVMVIIGMIAGLVSPSIIDKLFGTQRDTASTQLRAIGDALDQHRLDTSQYPDTLESLIKNTANHPKWDGPYLKPKPGIPKDPWGNDYQYKKPGREGRAYDLYSFGADGREGGEGDNADINGWEVKRK